MSSDAEKMLADLLLQVNAMNGKLDRLQSIVSGSPSFVEGWATPKDAAVALKNEGIKNAKHLQNVRLDGAFSELKGEIRNVSSGDRPTWEYHIPSCRKALKRYFSQRRSA